MACAVAWRLYSANLLKIGDIDPRGDTSYCNTISEKGRAIGGSVLETILRKFN